VRKAQELRPVQRDTARIDRRGIESSTRLAVSPAGTLRIKPSWFSAQVAGNQVRDG
jgi:hypothetical protein